MIRPAMTARHFFCMRAMAKAQGSAKTTQQPVVAALIQRVRQMIAG